MTYASRGWSRSVRSPHRILPVRLPGRRDPRARRSGTRLAFTGLRIVKTRARECKGESRGVRGTVPPVVDVSRERFEQMVADALDEIPSALGAQMDNVAVVVEEWANPGQLARLAPGSTLLGLYEGVPLTRRGPLSYAGVAPDRITIFRGPLSRMARDEDDLAARVRVTVLHEVGHYFGMSDERLRELGWG
jgi:predicted Zn-dependent protease with MMP-like domain